MGGNCDNMPASEIELCINNPELYSNIGNEYNKNGNNNNNIQQPCVLEPYPGAKSCRESRFINPGVTITINSLSQVSKFIIVTVGIEMIGEELIGEKLIEYLGPYFNKIIDGAYTFLTKTKVGGIIREVRIKVLKKGGKIIEATKEYTGKIYKKTQQEINNWGKGTPSSNVKMRNGMIDISSIKAIMKKLHVEHSVGWSILKLRQIQRTKGRRNMLAYGSRERALIIAYGRKEYQLWKTYPLEIRKKKVYSKMHQKMQEYQERDNRIFNTKNRKLKEKELKERDKLLKKERNNLFKEKIVVNSDIYHIKGNASGGGHFPSYKSDYMEYTRTLFKYPNGCKVVDMKYEVKMLNGNDISNTFNKRVVFPDNYGEKEYREIKKFLEDNFAEKIYNLDGVANKTINFRFKNINCTAVYSYDFRSKSGQKVYKLISIYPSFKQ